MVSGQQSFPGVVLALILGVGCQCDPEQAERTEPSATPSASASAAAAASSEPPVDLSPAAVSRGEALVARFECARCHSGTGAPEPTADKQCVGCHQAILAGNFKAPKAAIKTWQDHIVHLRHVPNLADMGASFEPAWLSRYLQEPEDLRPALPETMPRLALTAAQAGDIAAYLTRTSAPAPSAAPSAAAPSVTAAPSAAVPSATPGSALFTAKGCDACHAFTGSGVAGPPTAADPRFLAVDVLLAPDLRFTRQRLRRAAVAEWLTDPKRVRPGALMPKPDLTDSERAELTRFILEAPLSAAPKKALPKALPLLERRVGFDEVNQKVFRKVCWHCHAEPDFARGDGGPGMTGGFGFAARELNLASYGAILGGYLDALGERQSVFLPAPDTGAKHVDGKPMLLAVLLARQAEEAGSPGALRGMPLGLPALSPEQIQLVASWIEQGRPNVVPKGLNSPD